MDVLKDIRRLYTPRQPSIRKLNDVVSYNEFLPKLELQNYIYCFWELRTNEELKSPFSYRVVTDGCIDIFFELNKPDESYVMGFCKKYTEFQLSNSFHYFGIRFLPTIFPQVFNVNASLLSNQFQDLSAFSTLVADFISKNIYVSNTSKSIISSFDSFFLDTIDDKNFDKDDRLYDAIHLILRNFGVVNLENTVHTGISQRQLRRLFNYYIGGTPKSFCKVVQFQNILRAKPSTQSLKKNKIFYDLGYYDQAHFIKDFKNFYGVTPSKAFGKE